MTQLRRQVAPVIFLWVIAVTLHAATMLRGCTNTHTRPHGHQDITFRLDPQGKRLVFNALENGGRDLFLLDLDSMQVTRVTDTTDYETHPAFSPDGRSIVYAAGSPGDRADHLFMCDLDSNQVKQLTSGDANDCWPTFSPDGSRILFTRETEYNSGGLMPSWNEGGPLWTINRDGTGLKRELPSVTFALSPRFTSDGKRLSWCDGKDTWMMSADGTGSPRKIARKGWQTAITPKGDVVAFTDAEDGRDLRIYLMPTTGGRPTRLTETSGRYFHPEFSPDGKTVYFFVEDWPGDPVDNPKYSLWRVGTDGSNVRHVISSQLFDAPMSSGK